MTIDGKVISRRAFLVGSATAAVVACTSTKSSSTTSTSVAAGTATSTVTTTTILPTSAPPTMVTTLNNPTFTSTPFTLGVPSVRKAIEKLEPGTTYHYRFTAGTFTSTIGRTKTAPKTGSTAPVKFGFVSCQHYELGKYGVHAAMAHDDIDVVVFLGDFIYEYAPLGGMPREHLGGECKTLADYRRRYALYLTDPDIQASRAAHPWLVIWDDHEIVNNYHGDGGAPTQTAGAEFKARQAAAYAAWWEHQPTSTPQPTATQAEIYRTVNWGLANFYLTDGRQYRTPDGCEALADGFGKPCPAPLAGEIASVLGAKQEAWLADALKTSSAKWDVLTASTMMGRIKVGTAGISLVNLDQWDGYTNATDRVLKSIPVGRDVVVITGDLHTSVVADLITDIDTPAAKIIATEFVGPSVSSWADPTYDKLVTASLPLNPNVKYFEGKAHGYVRCDVTAEKFVATFRFIAGVHDAASPTVDAKKFAVNAGHPGALEVPLG